MTALLLAAALSCSDACRDRRAVEDALREAAAATSCDTATLRKEQHRVRLEIAMATHPEDEARLWREYDWLSDAIKRCGVRT